MIDRYLTADVDNEDVFSVDIEDDEIDVDSPDAIFLGNPQGKYIPIPDIAQKGQTIVVEAVDKNGKPTKWRAADFPKGGVDFTTDHTLSLSPSKVLSVNTAKKPDPDNTLPITAAAVAVTVGNIETILQTI